MKVLSTQFRIALGALALALLFAGIIVGFSIDRSNTKAERAEDIATATTQARKGSRVETCAAFFNLYRAQRNQIARDDIRLQSGAFDKILPTFSSPEVKRLSHESAVRRIGNFDNESLPNYCPQRGRPVELPRGFQR